MADDRPVGDPVQELGALKKVVEDLRTTLMTRTQRRPTGTIEPVLLAAAPAGCLLLQGQTVARGTYPALWQWVQDNSLITGGLFDVGDGSTTFGLPDMQGRIPIGAGTLGSDTYALGVLGGEARHTLTSAEMPSHTHSGGTSSSGSHDGHFPGSSRLVPGGTTYGVPAWNDTGSTDGAHTHSVTIGSTGSGGTHENRPPYLALNWLIYT